MHQRLSGLRQLAALALALWVTTVVPLATAQPLPAELFFKSADVIEAKLSPSGRRLAVTRNLAGERVGLFVSDLAPLYAGPGQAAAALPVVRAAQFADIDIRSFWWVNDERLVFDVIDLSEGSVQSGAPGLYAVKSDGEGLRELVARQGRGYFSASRAGRQSLSVNHRLLAVPQTGGDEIIVGEPRGAGGQLVAVNPLWLSTTSGRTRSAAGGGPANATDWLFDSRGEARVATSRSEGRRQVHWRAPGQDGWRQLDDGDVLQLAFNPAFVDDRGGLYVTRAEGSAGLRVLARYDFGANRAAATPFLRVPGFDYAGRPVLSPRSGELIGLHINAETETTVWLDDRMKRVQQLADDRFPGYVTRLQCARCGDDNLVVLVHAYSDRDPGHLWLLRPGPAAAAAVAAAAAAAEVADPKPQWQAVARVRRDVDPTRMAGISLHRIAARDGRELPVWLTLPPGRKPGDKGPAVVLVHGGPWVRGGHWRWSGFEQFLAARGYAVIAPEFRGSAGYGTRHLEAGFKQWGLAMQDDVADAARWAQAQGLADRFCIAGASYGGYSALMGLVRDADLYRCGIAWIAVTDPLLLLEGSWWIDDDISREGRLYTLPRMVGDAERDAAQLKAASPVEQAAHIRSPLLLAYGERDRRVPLAHGERLRRAMREAGHEPQWVTYPGEGHGWLKLETQLDFARRVEAFLQQHLAASPAAPPKQ